jgi:chemotaxis protein MotB
MSAGGSGHGGGKKKHKGGHEEEHENHERWLVSYADMMTLLMVLFIVMFAISAVDQKKFAQLKNGLAVGFGEQSVTFDGSTGNLEDNGSAPAPMSLSPQVEGKPKTPAQKQMEAAAVAAADRARGDQNMREAEKEVARLMETKRKIAEALKKLGQSKHVQFRIDERGLVVTVVSSEVIFHGDQAELLPGGQRVLSQIGPVLRQLPNSIEVDGHTNHLGVANPKYATSWELSTARAARVVRFLADRHYVAPRRLTAAGFGAERPLYPRNDPRAIKLNRRVDIIVLSGLPADQRALMPAVAGEKQG